MTVVVVGLSRVTVNLAVLFVLPSVSLVSEMVMLGMMVMGVLLMRMDTLSELKFATARSGMPSPFKSSAATEIG